MKVKLNIVAIGLTIFLFSACATYYQKQIVFQRQFASGNMDEALQYLVKNEKEAEKKDRLLYFLDRGVVEHLMGNYEASNNYFEQAYIFTQDFRKSFSGDFVEMTVNPMLRPYRGEDFEVVMIHFYKSLNYIYLDEKDNALVEIRRVNNKLNELNDKYEDKKNRYKEDAFAHVLMGLIYESKSLYNDAFIAYRNAYNAYESIYSEHFNVNAPDLLKQDLIRMAARNGFYEEQRQYEEKFGLQFEDLKNNKPAHLVFLWMNGLGPVKGEFSLNLSTVNNQGGVITFANEAEGFSIPYSVPANSSSMNFNELNFIRLAVPKYNQRIPLAQGARIMVDSSKSYGLEMAENINQIAKSTLQDRMLRELSKSIGRLAIKQAAQLAVSQENKDIGTVVSMLNAATEKADTRNWQTLPYSISYQKIPLDTGMHQIRLLIDLGKSSLDTVDYSIHLKPGETRFINYHSLSSSQPVL